MALSDYLTGDEFDAAFYAYLSGASSGENFGVSLHATIDRLLATGYRFPGLTETGGKHVTVEHGINAPKLSYFFGDMKPATFLEIVQNGRTWLKEHCPDLVSESDEEWAAQMQALGQAAQPSTEGVDGR